MKRKGHRKGVKDTKASLRNKGQTLEDGWPWRPSCGEDRVTRKS